MSKCTLKAKVFVIVTSFCKRHRCKKRAKTLIFKTFGTHSKMAGIGKYLFYFYYPTTIFLSLSLFFLFLFLVFFYLWLPVSLFLTLYQKYLTAFLFFLFASLEFTSHPPFISPLFLAIFYSLRLLIFLFSLSISIFSFLCSSYPLNTSNFLSSFVCVYMFASLEFWSRDLQLK